MDNDARAFNMAQEFMPQAHAFAGTLNQPGQIRHHEAAAITNINYPQVWSNCSKVIRSNLRLCR
ncbi:hypothetical protein D3C86_2190250 [compost metagenome]